MNDQSIIEEEDYDHEYDPEDEFARPSGGGGNSIYRNLRNRQCKNEAVDDEIMN